jgi:hypothetical protein
MDEQQSARQEHASHQHAHAGCFFCDVAAPQIEAFLDHVWPQNTREHFRNARIEMLKGMRSMLDARIDHLSRHSDKGTKVTVE